MTIDRPANDALADVAIDGFWIAGAVGVEELGDTIRAAFTDPDVAARVAETHGGSLDAVADTTGLDDWRDNAASYRVGAFHLRPPWREADPDGIDLVIDPVSDLGRARDLALRVLAGMSFVLQRPEPVAWVEATSPETLVIRAGGWVSQDGTDFDLARGEAFRLLRRAMDAEGFGLPEPIHRIHVEGADPSPAAQPVPRPAATRREKPPDLSPDATFEELLEFSKTQDTT